MVCAPLCSKTAFECVGCGQLAGLSISHSPLQQDSDVSVHERPVAFPNQIVPALAPNQLGKLQGATTCPSLYRAPSLQQDSLNVFRCPQCSSQASLCPSLQQQSFRGVPVHLMPTPAVLLPLCKQTALRVITSTWLAALSPLCPLLQDISYMPPLSSFHRTDQGSCARMTWAACKSVGAKGVTMKA